MTSNSVKNCLITTVDCLRYDGIGALSAEDSTLEQLGLRDRLETPNMDRIVEAGAVIPNLHAPYGSTPTSTSSLLTGLYPREHGVYDYFRPLKKNVKTLADYFGDAGYYTLLGAGHFFFDKMGILQSFDEHLKGPANSLVRRIEALNEEGKDVFAYYHTMDVHPPYLVSCHPPTPEYNDRAIELGNEIAGRLGQSNRFDREDIHIHVKEDEYRDLVSSEECPLWEFLNDYVLYHYRRDETVFDNPVQRLAELYVEGINRFDRYQFKSIADFVLRDENGVETNFFLTSDHGQYPRTIDGERTFYHRGKPVEDLITVPGVLLRNAGNSESVTEHSLTSLVDVAPSLLDACGIEWDTSEFSGVSLLEETTDRDFIYAEHSETVSEGDATSPPEESDFPLPALLEWSVLITSDGYKFYTDTLPVTRRDLNLETETFVRVVFEKINYQWLASDPLERIADDLENRGMTREDFVEEIMDESAAHLIELYRWRNDVREDRNLVRDEGNDLPINDWLNHLASRFPSNAEVNAQDTVETQVDDTADDDETTSKLEGFGYL